MTFSLRHFAGLRMADISSCPPLTRASVQIAHQRIQRYIHRTPVVTCETLNLIASTPQSERSSEIDSNEDGQSSTHYARPTVKLFFKCENQQKIGAFKARGAFHALGRLIEMEDHDNVRRTGVCTHSSGTLLTSSSQHITDS